jgi:hypothetical protein
MSARTRYRPMTPDEISMARAVSPTRVTYVPATGTKRFAHCIAMEAEEPQPQITERQAQYLRDLVLRFRRQLPAEIVALAGELPCLPATVPTTSAADRDAQPARLDGGAA